MKKITLKIAAFLLFTMSALQVHAQPCPDLWTESGIYKISTCGEATELYLSIDPMSGQLVWAEEILPDSETQLWTVTDHREPASAGYVEITANVTGPGDFTMIVDQATYDGTGSDPEIRITVRPGLPIADVMDPNYGYDQFQRRKATGWTGAGNNALFAKPPGQGNLRYGVIPTAIGEDVLFQNSGAIDPLRYVLVTSLSTEAFDASSIVIANPVNNRLSVKGLTSKINQIAVYSLLGQEVMSRQLNGESSLDLDVSALTSGMYIVNFKGENGSLTKKILKQ